MLLDTSSATLRSCTPFLSRGRWLRGARVLNSKIRGQERIDDILTTLAYCVQNRKSIPQENWVNYVLLQLLYVLPLNRFFLLVF